MLPADELGGRDASLREIAREADRQNEAERRAAVTRRKPAPVAATSTWDSSATPGAPARPLTRRQRDKRKAARRGAAPTRDAIAELVTPEARAHGCYRVQPVPGPVIGRDGEETLTTSDVVINRGGTAVERWFVNDRAGLFGEPQQQAIGYCRALWHRAGGLSAIDPTADRIDCVEGMSQQEALDELHDLKNRLPRKFWDVFENVCRFDQEAGVAGSALASNSRSAVDAAKTCVAFTASLIAQWRRL